MKVVDLEYVAYAQAWEYQQQLFDEILRLKKNGEKGDNTLLLCEHPHTITMGKHAKETNVLFNESFLKEKGISLFHTDRGGDVTYHGPGQLVGYPIFDLETFEMGLKQYIYNLEEVIIRLLVIYEIKAGRISGAPGVWIDSGKDRSVRKIAAIGVRCSRFVTMHGFALNVNTDLTYFKLINPCGFVDKGVTSMQHELGCLTDIEKIKFQLVELFKEIFKY